MDWKETVSVKATRPDAEQALGFTLPSSFRLCWTGTLARESWGSKFQRVAKAWFELELLSVIHGLRDCALFMIGKENQESYLQLFAARGLHISSAFVTSRDRCGPDKTAHETFVVGSFRHTQWCQEALQEKDCQAAGSLLGYPNCCAQALQDRFVCDGNAEPIWAAMLREVGSDQSFSSRVIEAEGYVANNMFLAPLGIRAVPHRPCRFCCQLSAEVAPPFTELGIKAGFEPELNWLYEILSWPVAWSALHGVAELKTPLFKLCMSTSATSGKKLIEWFGRRYPLEAACGNVFPYIVPSRTTKRSRSFQRGLIHLSADRSWR